MLEGSILKKLIAERAAAGQTPINFGVYYKNTLVALCHALEDCILASECQPLVITAFQRGKWYLQEADRYSKIAQRAEQVLIMAAPETGFHSHPTSQLANVALVDLAEDDPVAQEWHLMILSSRYSAMVLCQELSSQDYGAKGVPENDLERKFYGFWTFDPALVRQTIESAIAHIGRYNTVLERQLTAQLSQLGSAEAAPNTLEEAVARVVDYLRSRRLSMANSDSEGLFQGSEELTQNLVSNKLQAFLLMAELVDLGDVANPTAAKDVTALLEMMGQLLDLPGWRLKRLRLAGLLHRITPGVLDHQVSTDAVSYPRVSEVQVLRTMPQLKAIATIVAYQQEAWDGGGAPVGLSGDAIPLESRMLGLVKVFQQRLAERRQGQPDEAADQAIAAALEECQQESGQRWDPKLVEILALMGQGLLHGLSLPAIPSRVTLSSGLLEPDLEFSSESAEDPSAAMTSQVS